MFAKKRKAEEPPESPADDSDEFEPLPFIGRASVDGLLKEADEALAAIEQSAKQMRKKLREQPKTIRGLVMSNGGVPMTGPLSEEIEVNVGGTVLRVPRKPLLLPGVSESIIAYLLQYHLEGLPKDKDGRPFLDVDPVYLKWFRDEIANVGAADAQGESYEIKLTGDHSTDVSFAFWHELLFTSKSGIDIDMPTNPPPHNDDNDQMQVDNQQQQAGESASEEEGEPAGEPAGEQEGGSDHMATLKSSMAGTDASVGRLGEVQRGLATLARVGRDKRLYTTFHSGAPVSSISPSHLMKVTDFARRQRIAVIAPPGTLVRPPTAPNAKQIRTDTEMYGLKYEPFFSGVAGGDFVIETDDEMAELLNMTGKTSPMPSLMYKGSRDTYAFLKMLECTNTYKAPVFFFSLSGTYDAPTKIELSEDRQRVWVAGTQGAVTDTEDKPLANVGIGGGAAALWLGLDEPGPAADLSSCQQWIKRDELSEGYTGTINHHDQGTLAKSMDFTCDEMEIWQIATG
ncbi:unnamed protein product [Vitrella brassicaformis CCMP3155]|uniref:TLDc domain-containing protein n=1 Tax=Vitrella brassicaformis (strain CCMP3155) TaxID=1169540 RepID=A0A0G4EHK3_VITBC|nr:unnamed protein product [Vitrella brassicaformis CCMP3155]|eukprot:CEL95972.1 unnamed protein product [Vitrella brassicaformis CCMP3155]